MFKKIAQDFFFKNRSQKLFLSGPKPQIFFSVMPTGLKLIFCSIKMAPCATFLYIDFGDNSQCCRKVKNFWGASGNGGHNLPTPDWNRVN